MRSKQLLLAVLAPLPLLIAGGCSAGSVHARAAEPHSAEREIELTIYSQDFALVNEVRPVQLEAGLQRVDLRHVSKSLDPRSVMLSWASEGSDLPQLVSNAYDLGTENSASLLSRYVGQEVEVVRYGSDGDEAERIKGRLMISGSDIVLESEGKFIVNPQGTVVVPTASDVVTIPQLSVQVESPGARAADLDLSYLSRGLSWSADYVATLLPSGDAVSLQCWATVTNDTGTSFPKAKVVLMAGSPNRAAMDGARRRIYESTGQFYDNTILKEERYKAPATLGGWQAIDPTSIGDLKAYPVAKPADVFQGQMNRLLMLESQRVPISMDYSTRMPQLSAWGYQYDNTPEKSRQPVQMAFSFKNEKSRGLGSALPAGALRVYGEGAGSRRYLGAADVPDTPTDARVDVSLSNAFDLYTTTKVLESKKLDKKTVRKTIEISVFNEKDIETKVRVVQAIYGKFKVVSQSFESKKLDASNLQWTVPVPAGGKSVLKFTVDLGV